MAKIFHTEIAARVCFAKLDEVDLNDASEWEEPPMLCDCCQRWTGSNAYYGDTGGWVGGWCVYDEDGHQFGEVFDSICNECSDEITPESIAVATALSELNLH